MPYSISLMHICKNALAAPRPTSSTPSAHFYGSAISERDKNAEPLPTCIPLPLPSTADRDSQSGASRQGSVNTYQGFNKTASSPSQFFPRDVPRFSHLASLLRTTSTEQTQTHAIPMSADHKQRAAAHDSQVCSTRVANITTPTQAVWLPSSDWLDCLD